MYERACVASAALGPPPPAMGQSEADLHTFIHDLVHRDHDKDCRSLAAFPPKSAEHLACHILRVSHRGFYLGETVYGWDFDETANPHVWLLVHRGHMRLLIPPGPTMQGGRLAPRSRPRHGLRPNPCGRMGGASVGRGQRPPVRARYKALEACPRCPSACLGFHSWRTGLETYAFGRAPLPEFKIGAEPIRAVETHDLDNAKISDAQLQQRLRGIPTGSDQTTTLADCLRHGCDFLEVWGGTGKTTYPSSSAARRASPRHRARMGP